MSGEEVPTVGRIVHYVSRGSADGAYASVCRAAIITDDRPAYCEAHMQCVSLAVLNPEGLHLPLHVPHNETTQQRGGTWHWPERV